MSATQTGAGSVQGAPRRVVDDAWKSLNRRYAIGALVLLAALLGLWATGNGPGAWRAVERAATPAGSGAGVAASRDAGGSPSGSTSSTPPATAPAAPAAPAPAAASGDAPAAAASSGTAAPASASPAGNGGGAAGNGAATDADGAPLPAVLPGAPVARLYFEPDQAWPTGALGPRLAPVLARLKAEPDTKALVSGFHDRRGSAERNVALAQRRAQTVRRVLIREGVASDRIVLAKPQQSQGSGPDREARRVEVTVAR